jgi:hypothetical protein
MYAVLAIPLGFFIQWAWQSKPAGKIFLFGIAGLLVLLNGFQTWQFTKNIIIPERMTGSYYAAVFGKPGETSFDRRLMEPPLNFPDDSIPGGLDIGCSRITGFDFEQNQPGWGGFRSERFAHSGRYSLRMSRDFRYSPGLSIPTWDLTTSDSSWIRADASFYYTCKPSANVVFLVITSVHKGILYKYRLTELMAKRFSPGRWNRVSMTYLVPVSSNEHDSLHVFFWNNGEEECFIDDFEISLCKPFRRP